MTPIITGQFISVQYKSTKSFTELCGQQFTWFTFGLLAIQSYNLIHPELCIFHARKVT
jgi:hypothetical protein